jgi:hypothetical protein
MPQETTHEGDRSIPTAPDEDAAPRTADGEQLIRRLRRAAKRRRRLSAWLLPLIAAGMVTTVLVFSRVDMRLSLAVFGVSAAIVALVLTREACRWEGLSRDAAALADVRAIGPLLTVLNDRDSSACESIEETLIALLPRVERLSQLSRAARNEINRLLLGFEMPGLRGGHNADLAHAALDLVVRFRDCAALPAVRRLADGFTATRPSAAIRDLASDILPDLEQRAALLRPSQPRTGHDLAYLRPAYGHDASSGADDLLRSCRRSGSHAEPPQRLVSATTSLIADRSD